MKIKILVYDNFGLILADRDAESIGEAHEELDTIEKQFDSVSEDYYDTIREQSEEVK